MSSVALTVTVCALSVLYVWRIQAKAAERGLWSQPNPVPPWDWRRGEGVPQTAEVVGNRRSRVYHKPTCRGAAIMSEKNKVAFPSEADAEKAGYRKAKDYW